MLAFTLSPEIIDRLTAILGLAFVAYVAFHGGRYARECARTTKGWVVAIVISLVVFAFLMWFLWPSPSARWWTLAVMAPAFAFGIWDENRYQTSVKGKG